MSCSTTFCISRMPIARQTIIIFAIARQTIIIFASEGNSLTADVGPPLPAGFDSRCKPPTPGLPKPAKPPPAPPAATTAAAASVAGSANPLNDPNDDRARKPPPPAPGPSANDPKRLGSRPVAPPQTSRRYHFAERIKPGCCFCNMNVSNPTAVSGTCHTKTADEDFCI